MKYVLAYIFQAELVLLWLILLVLLCECANHGDLLIVERDSVGPSRLQVDTDPLGSCNPRVPLPLNMKLPGLPVESHKINTLNFQHVKLFELDKNSKGPLLIFFLFFDR